MAYELTASRHFFTSEDIPQVCIFSGRTTAVEERRFTVNRLSPWWVWFAVSCGLIGILGLVIALRKSVAINLPQARGELTRWHWQRYGWFLPSYVVVVILGVVARFADELGEPMIFVGLGVVWLLTILLAGYGSWWYRQNLVQLLPVDDKTVRLVFPAHMEETYQIYQNAVVRHDGAGRRDRRPAAEADDWTEEVGAGWDDGDKGRK